MVGRGWDDELVWGKIDYPRHIFCREPLNVEMGMRMEAEIGVSVSASHAKVESVYRILGSTVAGLYSQKHFGEIFICQRIICTLDPAVTASLSYV